MMEEIQLLEAVERYIRGEMSPEERVFLDNLRKSNPEVDQLVVEQTMFFNKLNQLKKKKNHKATLQEIHNHLLDHGAIKEAAPKAVVRELWKKYKRVMAVAASIAGVTWPLVC